jgi:hypothetical protein
LDGNAAHNAAETAHTAHLASHQQVLDVVLRLKTHIGTGGKLNTVDPSLMETATFKRLSKAAAAAPSEDLVSNQLKPLLEQLEKDLNTGMSLAKTENTDRSDTWTALKATKMTNIAALQAVRICFSFFFFFDFALLTIFFSFVFFLYIFISLFSLFLFVFLVGKSHGTGQQSHGRE